MGRQAPKRRSPPPASPFAKKLATLKAEPITDRLEPSEKLVGAFEKQFRLQLPDDYRTFLLAHGGTWVTALAPIKEPCPCGQLAVVEAFYGFMPPERNCDDIRWQTELCDGAPAAVPIAQSAFGCVIFLKLNGADAGHVYFYDADGRYFWPDELFIQRFCSLSSNLKRWLKLRKDGKLPRKRKGGENYYLLGDSFTAFFKRIKFWDLDD